MQLSDFCFVLAGLSALVAMGLGMVMGMTQDFTLAPAHAHLNLVGWVTMALYGLYHRGAGRTGGTLGWAQVLAGGCGALLMSGGLGAYLASDDDRFAPFVIFGSILAVLGMVLFVGLVLADIWRRRTAATAYEALSG